MGSSQSNEERELPDPTVDATLYYFGGRGLADQIRWLLAATNVSFTQKVIRDRAKFISMAQGQQLPFGQLPLLQIDKMEIVESQACIRYLAKRGKINGNTPQDEVNCDMLAEACRDLVIIACQAPFQRYKGGEGQSAALHIEFMKEKWSVFGSRFEAVISRNGGRHLVGNSLTYADVLVAHVLTWFVEECGPEITTSTPLLVNLQCNVIEQSGVKAFIQSANYWPKGNDSFVTQCYRVLGRTDQIKTDPPVAATAAAAGK